ncbi:hypothetical protein N7462_011294 [Penicillium macrosclerotiorum]|uniref:uncharacterized protein n=1 Tax=Penicillium macrosclerotiorum TaxID=303699 RepID=UPI00254890C5|nr:uncharacterized protein N7462_011294 [Penicillium macrosclerotiorum]KAJ5666885.1 hypothetical protein N7462_011294 [Penicillium macrosclerotiorum]
MLQYRAGCKPDDQLINQFRTSYGSLLYSHCQSKGKTAPFAIDKRDSGLPDGLDSVVMGMNNVHSNEVLMETSINPKAIYPQGATTPGSGAVFHNQAGDLLSSTFSWFTPTPTLSDELNPQASFDEYTGFVPFEQAQNGFHPVAPFEPSVTARVMAPNIPTYDQMMDGFQQQPTYGYNELQVESSLDLEIPQASVNAMTPNMSNESFRYNVNLCAPIAIFPHSDGSPVTYLNKGNSYVINIADSRPSDMNSGALEYRTHIRVTFEAEEQRSNPTIAWQLWKALRGQNGVSLGVEFDDVSQNATDNETAPRVRIEKVYTDGFSVIWTGDPTDQIASCNIPVRFNFLSTDFTRSKGVKGVPVRLCAKTEVLSESDEFEMCYGIIKLFRDHGAERKMSNDEASAKKRIEKLKKQIAEEKGKMSTRKQSWNRLSEDQKISKISLPKRRRSDWQNNSMLHQKLHDELFRLKDSLSAERQMSKLGLRGVVQDDPSIHPLILPTESSLPKGDDITRRALENMQSESFSPMDSGSKALDGSPGGRSATLSEDSLEAPSTFSMNSQSSRSTPASSVSNNWETTVNSLPRYVACFYVQFIKGGEPIHSYHHALYLSIRSEAELKGKLSEKIQIRPDQIQLIWANQKGVKVMVDDDMVGQIPEAQVITADISALSSSSLATSSVVPSPLEISLAF